MKTELPERSLLIKDRLSVIIDKMLSVAENKISKIILFGSYARGDWVRDKYLDGAIIYSYESDLDILIILKKGQSTNSQKTNVEEKIEKILEKENIHDNPWVTLITETIDHVNRQLEKNQYFFSDIKKEGILLYDDGKVALSEAKDLSKHEKREIATDDYDYWFNRGAGFLIDIASPIKRNDYNIAAFFLHQAAESFYNTILLVFTNYKPKLHDLSKLRGRSNHYHDDLLKIFTFDTSERRKCFILLKKAYVDARYNKNYSITKEQLEYLIERVEKLKETTKKICLDKIKS